jgi:hypothetical protein
MVMVSITVVYSNLLALTVVVYITLFSSEKITEEKSVIYTTTVSASKLEYTTVILTITIV